MTTLIVLTILGCQIFSVLIHPTLNSLRTPSILRLNLIQAVDLQAHRPRPAISRVVELPIHRVGRIRIRLTQIRIFIRPSLLWNLSPHATPHRDSKTLNDTPTTT